ncbi:Cstb, partial [Symbiodinium sp. KB8]
VKASVAAAVGAESVDTFEIIEFKSQVVAGTNYELKAKVDGVAYNIKAFAPLPHTGEPISISSAEKAE